MISLREIEYESEENIEQVFSRLVWSVEKVDDLFPQLMSNMTIDTARPWIGIYNKEKLNFGIIEPSRFLSMKFFQIVVRGQIKLEGNRTKINIKIRLGWFTLLVFLILYGMAIIMTLTIVIYGESKDIWNIILWVVFPLLGTFLLNKKVNKIENKVEGLLGVR